MAFKLFGLFIALWISGLHVRALTQISNCAQLQAMGNDLFEDYELTADIDCSSIPNFAPIGDRDSPFTGRLFGNGYVIYDLTINFAAGVFDVGMFSVLSSAHIENVGLKRVNISDVGTIGGLAGDAKDASTIRGCFVEGQITSIPTPSRWANWATIGLLVGETDGSTVESCHARGNITGIGVVEGTREPEAEIGGLIGHFRNSTLIKSYADVSVSTDYLYGNVGGLFGYCWGTVTQSYSSGDVLGTLTPVGGIAGDSRDCFLSNSYAVGAVTSERAEAGGLFGEDTFLVCMNSYAAGCVRGKTASMTGGLVGGTLYSENVQGCYWDEKQTGQFKAAGGSANFELREFGKDTSALYSEGTFVGWDFQAIWAIREGESYPFLQNVSYIVPVSLDLTCKSFSSPFAKEIKKLAIAIGVIAAVALVVSFVIQTLKIRDNLSQTEKRQSCKYLILQYPVLSIIGYLLEVADKISDLFLIKELLENQQDDLAIAAVSALGVSYLIVLIGLTKINEGERGRDAMPCNFWVWLLFWPALSPELNHLLSIESEVSQKFALVKVMNFLAEDVSQFTISVIFLIRKGNNDVIIAKLALVMIVSLFFLLKLFCYDLKRKQKKSGLAMK